MLSRDPRWQKAYYRKVYNEVNHQRKEVSEVGIESYFLTLGYVTEREEGASDPRIPDEYRKLPWVRLVSELIGDEDVRGQRILDVGCGRGGTIWMLTQFYQANGPTGVDLSTGAVAFCERAHKMTGAQFRVADAERLPFEPRSFDVVTNIESSHCYPRVARFYEEVNRVLIDDGRFFYADVIHAERLEKCRANLQEAGFRIEGERDISKNAVMAMIRAAPVEQVFEGAVGKLMANSGPFMIEGLTSGAMTYRLFRLRKERRSLRHSF
jgi:phthiocerol/phenolphthiocerol synthesis type-I polyketide synthase E